MSKLRTIAILGPESSGKSTLCAQLATHLNSVWVREYAREYVPARAGAYDEADLLAILNGQNSLIHAGILAAQQSGASYLIADTEATVLAVWAQALRGELFSTSEMPKISPFMRSEKVISLPVRSIQKIRIRPDSI